VAASTSVPNPKRVAAGKRNRRLRRGLTSEGRSRLRLAALAARPWRFSTGPRSPEGRARVAQNGKRRLGGEPSAREVRRELAALTGLVVDMAALRRLAQRPHRGGELNRE
jgi:hypothetical protein